MARFEPRTPPPPIENLKRCAQCKAISPFVSDTTYGGYKFCGTCRAGLTLEEVPRSTVEAAFAVVTALLHVDAEAGSLREAVARYRTEVGV